MPTTPTSRSASGRWAPDRRGSSSGRTRGASGWAVRSTPAALSSTRARASPNHPCGQPGERPAQTARQPPTQQEGHDPHPRHHPHRDDRRQPRREEPRAVCGEREVSAERGQGRLIGRGPPVPEGQDHRQDQQGRRKERGRGPLPVMRMPGRWDGPSRTRTQGPAGSGPFAHVLPGAAEEE